MATATVRAAAMNGWESFLEDRTGAPVLSDGPPPDSMPLADFVRFSEDVVARTRAVAIPWLAGSNYDLAALGPLGDAINSAGRVGSALRRLVDYFSLLQDCTDIRLGLEDDMAAISYRILDPDIWPRHHDAMFTLGIVSQILKRGTRGGWDKIEFAFEAESHEMRGDIGKVVCAPCTFGADTKLTEQGSSFQQVLDECRMRQAVFEFRVRPDLSIAQIALRLGYAEHSNFTRAFHRWSGVSPQAYRGKLAGTAH